MDHTELSIGENPRVLVLNGKIIQHRPEDDYVELTSMNRAGGKLYKDWRRLESTQNYIDAVSEELGKPVEELIVAGTSEMS